MAPSHYQPSSVPKVPKPVHGFGPTPLPPPHVMVVGEGPGPQEAEYGLPFYDPDWYRAQGVALGWRTRRGASGVELTRLLTEAGLDRSQTFVTNLTRTHYKDEKLTQARIDLESHHLARDIRLCQPQWVIAVGRHAARHFLGDVDMEMVHGLPFRAVIDQEWGVEAWVVPCYHPAAGMYSPEIQPLIFNDFVAAGRYIRGEIRPDRATPLDPFTPDQLDYREMVDGADDPGLYQIHLTRQWKVAGSPREIFVDSEGSAARPWSVQYSFGPGTGYLIRPHVSPEWWTALRQFILDHHLLVVFHNCMHDISVLRALDFDVVTLKVPFTDTMLMAYWLCVEPQGLKQLAFRRAGMAMSSYQDLVGPYEAILHSNYLTRVLEHGEWPKPPAEVVMEQGRPKVYQPQAPHTWARRLDTDLKSGKVNKEGEPPSISDRWWGMPEATRQMVEAALGPFPEATLDDVPLEDAIYYGCRDSDATSRIYPGLAAQIRRDGLDVTRDIDLSVAPMVERMQHVGMPFDRPYFTRLNGEMEQAMLGIQSKLAKMGDGYDINPNSGPQVEGLLFDLRGVESTKRTKKGKRSTNKKAIENLRGTDEAVDHIINYREHDKVRTFAATLKDVTTPQCHCTIRISRVSSGRLSATGPNLLAIPVRTELGQKVRKGFVANPIHLAEGHMGVTVDRDGRRLCPQCGLLRRLGTFDLDQVEMRVMAHESQDPLLVDLFIKGALYPKDPQYDIHTRTGSQLFGVPLNKVDKMLHRYPAKRCGFGVITGIQAQGLFDQLKMAGITEWSVDDCQRMIDEWFKMYPGVRQYMMMKRQEALRGFVTDMWGRRRYLPGAHSPLEHIKEEALRQSHSHAIQAGAQGLIKRAMAVIWHEHFPILRQLGFVECLLQIHDELIFWAEDGMEHLIEPYIVDALVNTTRLSVPLGAKGGWGDDWASLEK